MRTTTRIALLALASTTVGLLTACGSGSGGTNLPFAGSTASCEQALVAMLRTGIAEGANAPSGSKPAACNGLSDATLQSLASEAMSSVMASAMPSVIASAWAGMPTDFPSAFPTDLPSWPSDFPSTLPTSG